MAGKLNPFDDAGFGQPAEQAAEAAEAPAAPAADAPKPKRGRKPKAEAPAPKQESSRDRGHAANVPAKYRKHQNS